MAGTRRATHEKEHSPMKRLSRFNKVLITVGVVAASGGVSLGITSLVSANNSVQSEVASINGTGTITGDLSVASADDAIAASGDVSVASDGSTVSAETKVMHTGGPGPHSEAMAELFGMTVDELHDALHSGKSLATIAEERNVALSKVTDLLVAEFSAHLDEEVASGEHTREEADAKLAEFKANVDQMVTKTRPTRGELGTRGEGGPHGEMGPRGGRHGGGQRGFSSHETPRELGELEGSGTAFVQA